MQLLQLSEDHYSDLISLANQVHGDNYLDTASLQSMHLQGIKHGLNASFVAVDETATLVGYRLSFAPGQWQLDQWCSVTLWPVAADRMAYFKSVAVAPSMRGQGVASALLTASARVLVQQGAAAGLAHIWRESPGNAAERYFNYAGGTLLKVHPNRWRHLSDSGYLCPRCGERCSCSAAEMLLQFKDLHDV